MTLWPLGSNNCKKSSWATSANLVRLLWPWKCIRHGPQRQFSKYSKVWLPDTMTTRRNQQIVSLTPTTDMESRGPKRVLAQHRRDSERISRKREQMNKWIKLKQWHCHGRTIWSQATAETDVQNRIHLAHDVFGISTNVSSRTRT